MKIQEKLKRISSKYKKITKYKFAYNVRGDLLRKYNRVKCYFLIYSKENGHSIMEFVFKRKEYKHVSWWKNYLKTEGVDDVFIGKVLASINTRPGATWLFKDLILWKGIKWSKEKEVKAKRKIAKKKKKMTKRKKRVKK